jgi:predicted ATPase
MKIHSIFTHEAGPLGSTSFSFKDEWSSDISPRILFSGPNGCGKSSMLRAIATLWQALGHWLHTRNQLPKNNPEREWLQRWGGIAIAIEELPFNAPAIVLIFGEKTFVENLQKNPDLSDHTFIGEWVERTGKPGAPARKLLWPTTAKWLDEWTEARQRMIVTGDPTASPNMIFLDAEERRWIKARRDVGEIRPEDLQQRWLSRYIVSERWDGQLEASLLAMKTASDKRFRDLVKDMNAFLHKKRILPEVKLGENRLRIKLDGVGGEHGLDELSAGEHQVLILLFQIGRWLETGGIALIDEPDLYLHPSLVAGLLARLEKMVSDRKGQLIITSHVPDVWARYEALGLRILLGEKAAGAVE